MQLISPRNRQRKLLGAAIVAAALLVTVAWATFELVTPYASGVSSEVMFTVTSGETVHQIASNLQSQHIIRSQWWFRAWVWLLGREHGVVAGEYHFPARLSLLRVIQFISGGLQPATDISLRFIEGWTLQQMAAYSEDSGFSTAKAFERAVTKPAGANACRRLLWIIGFLMVCRSVLPWRGIYSLIRTG